MIVEDDERAASLLSHYLGRGGYRTTIATDGRIALDRAKELVPAAITLDVMLPSLDGWEVLRALKLDIATRDIPVVIASIVDESELGYALGATDYFVKPVDRQTLLDRLDRYTGAGSHGLDSINVLIADDEPTAVELLSSMLAHSGCSIQTADGGAAAIATALELRPDVILLDLMMPEVDGFAVVDALRADPTTRNTPILIVTAKDITDEDKLRLNGRVTAILHKGSFGAIDLLSWLDTTLHQVRKGKESVHGT
jgi:CheY-like chemotaxis protein